MPAAPVSKAQQQVRQVVAAVRVAGHDDHGVVARDGAEHGLHRGPVDHRGHQLRRAGRRPAHDQVAACLSG
jgi:hypothetical protein